LDLAILTDFAEPVRSSAGGWLVVAFVLGLVHAVDADHVMALSVFATRARGAAAGARAGMRWSLGHGGVVLVVGSVLVALGSVMPASYALLAERAVGLTMIGLGFFVWLELARRRVHLHFHAHDGFPPHAHWHAHARSRESVPEHRHEHGALFVGALHGLAGSAPILAVLPIARTAPWIAGAYLVLFGAGVTVAMVGVSGMLGHVAGRLSGSGRENGLSWLRAIGAGGSVAMGAWVAFSA
jgi:hypothetical protein